MVVVTELAVVEVSSPIVMMVVLAIGETVMVLAIVAFIRLVKE